MSNRIAIIGLGYVGLPLAVAFGRAGVPVVGIDLSRSKVDELNAGRSYIPDVPAIDIAALVKQNLLRATSDYAVVREAEAIFICVPTPYDLAKAPDLSFIISAAEGIVPHLQKGHLVVLQSTTYPGTTDEMVLPILERSGLKLDVDFDLAFSPERIDPGNTQVQRHQHAQGGGRRERARHAARGRTVEAHRRTGGDCVERARGRDDQAAGEYLPQRQHRAGERDRAVVRADEYGRVGSDPRGEHEAVRVYAVLSGRGRGRPLHPDRSAVPIVEGARVRLPYQLHRSGGRSEREHALSRGRSGDAGPVAARTRHQGQPVLVLGVAFKRDIDDPRNSPAERVIELLLQRGAQVQYHDQYVPQYTIGPDAFCREKTTLTSMPLDEAAGARCDGVVIVTGHRNVDYQHVIDRASAVVDCCNATFGLPDAAGKVVKLGVGVGRNGSQ